MIVHTNLIGRLGNQLFQYSHARAYAEREGATLATPPWIGEQIFQIPEADRSPKGDVNLRGYFQDQESLIYTRKQVKEWFRLKPEVEASIPKASSNCVTAHRRVGDYAKLGYVVVSEKSYEDALKKFDLGSCISYVTEESGNDFLQDFYRLMTAPILLRGNSTFSFWAATLGNGRVFSPVIDSLPGGEQDCDFVEGNHPKFCSLSFVTDLHLSP
jgi:hypothetical protein